MKNCMHEQNDTIYIIIIDRNKIHNLIRTAFSWWKFEKKIVQINRDSYSSEE